MKLLIQYLERARQLQKLAASETESAFKDQLLGQALAYRKLAEKRAKDHALPAPNIFADDI